MIKRASRVIEGSIAALAANGWRLLPVFAVVLLVLVLSSLMLTPMNALWSKNLVIKGDVDVREVPERCRDMQFDSYFWGTNGDDRIDGTEGNDMIWGLNGHDQIYGHGGSDCFDGGDDDDKCDDDDGWYDADEEHSSYDVAWGEHESKRNSCDQWGSRFQTTSWWHHSTPTIELAWDPLDGALYYNIYRSDVSGGPYTGIASSTGSAYTDMDVLEDTTYYYVVTAIDAEGFESVPSVETAQMVPSSAAAAPTPVASGPLAAPIGLTASYEPSVPAVDLTWSPVDGAAYYNVYRGDAPGGLFEGIGSSPAASFQDPWIAEGATYYYRVTAVSSAGAQSGDSNEVAVTTTPSAPEATVAPEQTPEPTPEPTVAPEPTGTPEPTPDAVPTETPAATEPAASPVP